MQLLTPCTSSLLRPLCFRALAIGRLFTATSQIYMLTFELRARVPLCCSIQFWQPVPRDCIHKCTKHSLDLRLSPFPPSSHQVSHAHLVAGSVHASLGVFAVPTTTSGTSA